MANILVEYKDIEQLFGEKLSEYVRNKISDYNLIYSPLDEQEKDEVIIKIIDTLLDPYLVYSGPHRLNQWEEGWGQNLSELNNGLASESISPRYFGKYVINRLGQNFIKAVSPDFEKNMLYIILYYVFDKYLREVDNIYEFGCGSGHNLLKAHSVNPSANLYGLDWTKASQKILKQIAESGLVKNIQGFNFNFFNPDSNIKIENNSAIYTVAALEQTGDNYKEFISYLLQNKPKLCLHIEPIAEVLDEKNLIDNLSIKYFTKRNYLNGFLGYLQKLEAEGALKIHDVRRTFIGSMFIEGYSIIVWSTQK